MNIATILLPERVVEALGWTLFHSLWQGALAALGFALVLYFTRRGSARLRYGLGLMALGLALVAFVATFWARYTIGPAASAPVVEARAADAATRPALPAAAAAGQERPLATRIASFFSDYFGRHLPLIVTLWLLGVLFLSLRFTGSLLYVQRLKYRQIRPLPAPWPERLEALARRAGLRRPLQLLESLRLRTPVVIGHLKPALLLPAGLVSGLPADEVEALLAHELAHVLRRDYLVNALQNLVDILFFFHPGVRWISACVRQEREHCCDDVAVELCGDPGHYARALARLQVAAGGFPEPALAAGGRPRLLLRRITRLLGGKRLAHDYREGFASALLLVLGLLGMLRLAAATGGSVPALLLAGTEKKPGPQAAAKSREPSRFQRFSFALKRDGTVELAGEAAVGPGGPPTSWLLDMGSGEVVWYMAAAGMAKEGSKVRFSEEVALGRGAYGWYLPVGCAATARLKDSPVKGEWRELVLSSGGRDAQVDRWRSGAAAAGGEELLKREQEELLKAEQEEFMLQEEQLRQELRAYAKRRLDMSEEEQRLRQHELQEQLARLEVEHARRRAAEEEAREQEGKLRAEELRLRELERAAREEELQRLRAEEERLRQEQRLARSDEERQRLEAEIQRSERELRKGEEAVRKREQELWLQSEQELKRAQEELHAQEKRLLVEEANFKKFLAELAKAGLVDEAGGYEIKLSASALVINGRKQPREVFQKFRQLYETIAGKRIEGERTITFVSDGD